MQGADSNLDPTDRELLDLLAEDARRSAASLAREIHAEQSTVRRRIARLIDDGVIVRFTTMLAHDKVGPSADAFVVVTLGPKADVNAFVERVVRLPKVREASQLAGPKKDALVRVRTESNDAVAEIVNKIRKLPDVEDTETLIALNRQRHVAGGRDAMRES